MNDKNFTRMTTPPDAVDFIEVTVPRDISLVDVDAIVLVAADARCGLSGVDAGSRNTDATVAQRWTNTVAKMRTVVFRAARLGALKLRDVDGIASEYEESEKSLGSIHADREEFSQFAHAELRIKIINGPSIASLGRYSLESAARIITGHGDDAAAVLQKLKVAVRSGLLPVYSVGTDTPMRLADDVFVRAYGRAKSSDLDAWVAENMPRSDRRFSPPFNAYLAHVEARSPKVGKHVGKEKVDWRSKAREIADEVALERCKQQGATSAHAVCKEVAKRLAKLESPKYHGAKGERSWHNVRNEGLSGWRFVRPESVD